MFNVSQRIVAVVAGGPPLHCAWWSASAHLPEPGEFISRRTSSSVTWDSSSSSPQPTSSLTPRLVSMVVAISSERSFREVWNLNTRGVLGYDIGASLIALLVAWLYTSVQRWVGFGPLGLIGVVIPVVAVRHVYGMYHQLQESGEELLQLMVKAIEARDPYTSGHSLRVRALSRAIAAELGLSTKEIEQVETAALLHDVGKIHEEFAPLA